MQLFVGLNGKAKRIKTTIPNSDSKNTSTKESNIKSYAYYRFDVEGWKGTVRNATIKKTGTHEYEKIKTDNSFFDMVIDTEYSSCRIYISQNEYDIDKEMTLPSDFFIVIKELGISCPISLGYGNKDIRGQFQGEFKKTDDIKLPDKEIQCNIEIYTIRDWLSKNMPSGHNLPDNFYVEFATEDNNEFSILPGIYLKRSQSGLTYTYARGYNGYLFIATDSSNWKLYNPYLSIQGSAENETIGIPSSNGKLRMFGLNNTVLSCAGDPDKYLYTRWQVHSDSNIKISGKMDNLLDAMQTILGKSPKIDKYCCNGMFYADEKQNKNIVSIPTLPSTKELTIGCFEKMFANTSVSGEITFSRDYILKRDCFNYMLANCENLTKITLPYNLLQLSCFSDIAKNTTAEIHLCKTVEGHNETTRSAITGSSDSTNEIIYDIENLQDANVMIEEENNNLFSIYGRCERDWKLYDDVTGIEYSFNKEDWYTLPPNEYVGPTRKIYLRRVAEVYQFEKLHLSSDTAKYKCSGNPHALEINYKDAIIPSITANYENVKFEKFFSYNQQKNIIDTTVVQNNKE